MWPAQPRSDAAVALQLSGHLMRCDDFRSDHHAISQHLRACRARFARCDLFVHSWTTLAPRTVHWQHRYRGGRNVSSEGCLRSLERAVRPQATLVEEQGDAPDANSLAPDGEPFTESGAYAWGAERYWGYMKMPGPHTQCTTHRVLPSVCIADSSARCVAQEDASRHAHGQCAPEAR